MSHNSIGSFTRRKRSVVSCRECQRRKQKCDRRQPCSHCMKRGKADVCLYDLDANRVPSTFLPVPVELQNHSTNGVLPTPPEPTPAASSVVPDDFKSLGYGDNTKGTPGVLRSLGESASVLHHFPPRNRPDPSQYTSIIRELPPRRHIDILVQDFFKNVAWHYDIVDEAMFLSQLSQWSRLTHDQLKQGPDALPINLRSFPALLFQILSQALLFQPTQHEESLNDLKYAADMELSDRAADFSDAGHRLASSFRKSELTLTIVQAGLMRACFQKTTGAVIEAWHTLGNAIRDAQELGLHLLKPESTSYLRTENLSDSELSRNVWHMLHLWDVHMATVLGRPISTRMSPKDVPLPMSARDSSGRQRPPQPRDVIWCGYHTAYKFLQDIHDLEKVEDWHIPVETIHETILTNIANLPAWAAAQRLRQEEPPWLSAALEEMYTNVHFVVFALHRPFVFAEMSSRHNAFHSAMQIFESQARLFNLTEPLQYKAFSLVYATFDAMVLVAAMHIRFPDEFVEQFPTTRRNLEWGLERLKSLQARKNDLAATALNIIQQLYRRMLTAVSAIQPQGPYHGVSKNGDLEAMEAETARVNWDTILQPDLGDLFVPQPLNELLCNGYFGQPLNISPADPIGYGPCQFGSDITGSLGNDVMTDHSTGEASNMPSS